MKTDHVAKSMITVEAPARKVWQALVTPDAIKQYMFGTTVESDWKEGSPITWKGNWKGKSYEDKGVIVRVQPGRTLAYTHFSPLSGLPDTPDNYHTVTVELTAEGDDTRVALSQDNNPTEEARQHSETNWGMMLSGLKSTSRRGVGTGSWVARIRRSAGRRGEPGSGPLQRAGASGGVPLLLEAGVDLIGSERLAASEPVLRGIAIPQARTDGR